MQEVVVTEYGDPSVMELRESEPPEPGAGDVLVDVEGIGVNWAEIDRREGNYPGGPEPPFTSGFEAAGVVSETGKDVEQWDVGDEVFGIFLDGAYAEQAVTPAEHVFSVPEGIGLTTAAGLIAQGFTAHNVVLERGAIQAGETVLIHAAAGGVGSKAVQIASAVGAEVIGTASTAEKLAYARENGADHTINYETEDVAETVNDLVGGVDVVLDGVGGRAFYESFDCLPPGGRIVVYGAASGNIATVATPRIYKSDVSVIGYDFMSVLDHDMGMIRTAADYFDERLADGEFDVGVTDERPLSEAPDVHREMQARETTGKVVLVPE